MGSCAAFGRVGALKIPFWDLIDESIRAEHLANHFFAKEDCVCCQLAVANYAILKKYGLLE